MRSCFIVASYPGSRWAGYQASFIGTGIKGGGRNRAREIVASRVQAPPAFCTEAKVAKGGAYLRDTTVHHVNLCYCRSGKNIFVVAMQCNAM